MRRELPLAEVARHRPRPRGRDPDERLAPVALVEPHRAQVRAGAGAAWARDEILVREPPCHLRDPSPMTSDVAIVGAGMTGLSVAFHLAERGVGRIVVYEREGIGAGASGVQPGGVRQQWSTRLNCRDGAGVARVLPRARRAAAAARGSAGSAPAATSSSRTSRRRWSGCAATSRCRTSSASRRGCSRRRGRRSRPGSRASTGASGRASAPRTATSTGRRRVVEAFAEAARRLGVVDRARERDGASSRDGERLATRVRRRTQAPADSVVVAAAVDTPALFAPLGIELPIVARGRGGCSSATRSRSGCSSRSSSRVDRRFAAKQLADGRVLASDLDASGDRRRAGLAAPPRARRRSVELLPRLEFVALPLLVARRLRRDARPPGDRGPGRRDTTGSVGGRRLQRPRLHDGARDRPRRRGDGARRGPRRALRRPAAGSLRGRTRSSRKPPSCERAQATSAGRTRRRGARPRGGVEAVRRAELDPRRRRRRTAPRPAARPARACRRSASRSSRLSGMRRPAAGRSPASAQQPRPPRRGRR